MNYNLLNLIILALLIKITFQYIKNKANQFLKIGTLKFYLNYQTFPFNQDLFILNITMTKMLFGNEC